MAVTAKLSLTLFADDLLVAESEDQQLWRRVFGAIQTDKPETLPDDEGEEVGDSAGETKKRKSVGSAPGPLQAFAEELGVDVKDLVGACSPSSTTPFIELDQRYWEALRKNTGSRGRDAIAPVTLAGTLLALWFKHSSFSANPTVQQCQDVLATINLRDQNAARSLKNAEWLQTRNGGVVINPAQWSQAVRVAKGYCLKQAPKELD
jgi:hypothetical protein